jgi:aspartate-semialdehyde dehydrogenase
VGIEQVEITTLQAVSGRGKEGVEELASQTVALLNMRPVEPKLFTKQIAFNLYPQIEPLESNGYSGEEMKIIRELRRLLGEQELSIHVTAVRVPVFHGHSAAVRVVLRHPFSVAQAAALLGKSASIAMLEDPNDPPTPVTEAAGKDVVWLGRLRQDLDDPHALGFWIVTDNLRKGGALNVVEAAEIVKKGYLDV